MKDLFDKLTTYNIFNYLFPGILFVVIANAITDYNLIQENNFLGAFLYYFIGMTISRFGSVIIEPTLKKLKFIKFREYKDFVNASKQDTKIELFSEINNTYRTLNSMLLLLLALKLYNTCAVYFKIDNSIALVFLTVLITSLYLFSYRKQTNYITKRIDANNKL
jgi:hypothetical protein